MPAESNRITATYEKEASYGVNVGSAPLNLRSKPFAIDRAMTALLSDEMRSDSQVAFHRLGMHSVAGAIPAEVTHLAHKDLYRFGLRYLSTLGSFTSTSGVSTAFAASGKTITRVGGSYIADGAVVGMKIRVTGSTSNDGVYTINTVTALVITVDETLVDEAAAADVKMQGEYSENGTLEQSFSMEQLHPDISEYLLALGGKINGINWNFQPDAIPEVSFDTMFKTLAWSAASVGAATDVDTTEPCTTLAGHIKEAGVASTVISGLTIGLDNGRSVQSILAQNSLQSIGAGRCNVSGEVTAWLEDSSLVDKFHGETETAIEIETQDSPGNAVNILMENVRFEGANRAVSNDAGVTVSLPYKAIMDATSGKTIKLNMIPAVAV